MYRRGSQGSLLFHKNVYSDEFIDTNYYKQNKQNDEFELYMTKDRFYKAYGTLPTKTPTDFDKYVTAAQLAVYKLVTDICCSHLPIAVHT